MTRAKTGARKPTRPVSNWHSPRQQAPDAKANDPKTISYRAPDPPSMVANLGSAMDFQHDFSSLPITAQLPSPDEVADPIHQPLIDQYRRELGLPPGGVDEAGQRIGPSDAEIKYGSPMLRNPSVFRNQSVFYINFHHASPPGMADHSQQHPGPGGSAAQRAGYTRVRVQKRMSISWDTLPARSDGRVPLYAQSVNVFYRLDPIEMMVSSDYAVGSCPYRVTLEHERAHVRDFLRIFREAREPLIAQLEAESVPSRQAPQVLDPANVVATQDAIGEQLRQVILAHSAALVGQMEADRNAKDAPAAYAADYARCPAHEW